MSAIVIRDLARSSALDRSAMSKVRGGFSPVAGQGPFANVSVNVGVSQSIAQLQNVEVNTLNNVGVIGAGFVPLKLDVSPVQLAAIGAVV